MIGRLRSLWNAPAPRPAPPKRVWRDWVLVAALPAIILFESLVRSDVRDAPASAIILIAAVATMLWRRVHPLLMWVIAVAVTGAFLLVTGHEIDLYSSAFLVLLIYSIYRWGSARALVVGTAITAGSTAAGVLLPPVDVANLIGGSAIVTVVALVGLLFRFRAGFRMRELDRAKSNERVELARDLHDTVAHHVSAIAIQAQAGLAIVGTNPDAATAALRVIEAEASRTLTEMRSMVRVLRRDDTAELAPTPRIADLQHLAGADRGGPTVEVSLTGETDDLPDPLATAIYRIAQESVTNARRHARNATRVEVRVDVDAAGATLTVHDDGTSGAAGAIGYGITGMTERATLLGGTCTAGPDARGGWTVTAYLPRAGAAS